MTMTRPSMARTLDCHAGHAANLLHPEQSPLSMAASNARRTSASQPAKWLPRLGMLASAAVLVIAAGCAQFQPVASGETVVKDRLVLQVDKPWNQFASGAFGEATPTWTREGVTVDAVRFYVGLKNGALLAPTPTEPKGQKPLAFESSMSTTDVVALFEALYSRGGSSFTLERVQPMPFAGGPGFRFDFSSVRKLDDVRLQGVAWGTVRNGELTVITYTAPRLAFFERHLPSIQSIVASARLK
jgi:hypothetical protein